MIINDVGGIKIFIYATYEKAISNNEIDSEDVDQIIFN